MGHGEELQFLRKDGQSIHAFFPRPPACDGDICQDVHGNVALCRGITIRRGDVEDVEVDLKRKPRIPMQWSCSLRKSALMVFFYVFAILVNICVSVETVYGIVEDLVVSHLGKVAVELEFFGVGHLRH